MHRMQGKLPHLSSSPPPSSVLVFSCEHVPVSRPPSGILFQDKRIDVSCPVLRVHISAALERASKDGEAFLYATATLRLHWRIAST